ncbi:hypothetical protein A0J48_003465 [Sphaerospermopsis aphanizomenoides BCCUSP55]|uniref:hypothetical protein n=1 Tax=Sphaerospermopsis aphanizomenoides TaxID=459663 RepID=UPI00190851AE|nr:hypothetical protein [Sphaerospermopsis aphanizomenoides]MBK1986606.1 hypothetical protein [Sphaerospermopsis aphanizomenoides BCCUSP55]
MFHTSVNRPIDNQLKNIVKKIETDNPNFSVLAARQFRYSLRQNTVELTIKEPRQFNVLEEFIIRAGIEFNPPPTADELASVLGLDSVFVKSTISNLQTLQTLVVKSPITVTEEGRLFYERGTVPQPPYTIQIYATSDSLDGKIYFQSESLNDNASSNLPDLATFVNLESKNQQISSLSLENIQQMIQDSGLTIHVPEAGKLVTAFKVIPPTQTFWKTISLFVIFNAKEDKLNIQIRRKNLTLDTASNLLNYLFNEGRIYLESLFDLSAETINFATEAIRKNS